MDFDFILGESYLSNRNSPQSSFCGKLSYDDWNSKQILEAFINVFSFTKPKVKVVITCEEIIAYNNIKNYIYTYIIKLNSCFY
jgi:hypothetical protein